MNSRRLTPEEARHERAKTERAAYIVSKALANKDLMDGAREGLQESERGEGKSLEQVCEE